jgi:hypothetical protein
VPLGFGVWLAHYGFHFLTGMFTVIPVTQNAVHAATGRAWLGVPQWQWGGLPEKIVFPMELGFLGLGLAGTLLVGWRIAAELAPDRRARAFAPWATLGAVLFASACWILTQPMDMRGTFAGPEMKSELKLNAHIRGVGDDPASVVSPHPLRSRARGTAAPPMSRALRGSSALRIFSTRHSALRIPHFAGGFGA